MAFIKKNVLVSGGSGMLGAELIKELRQKFHVYTLGRNRCDYFYDLATPLNQVLEAGFKADYFFHLAYDHSNQKINGEDINIYAMKDAIDYCQKKGIHLVYISSMAALSAKSLYGKNKRSCEILCESLPNCNIVRLGMVYGPTTGLIYKIQSAIGCLPFCPLPGDGKFKVYMAELSRVVKYLSQESLPAVRYIYLTDQDPQDFKSLINLSHKPFVKIPIPLIQIILYIPHAFGFRLKHFSYDGFQGLINPPQLPQDTKTYE